MKRYATPYRDELLNKVIPFWEKNTMDEECGGYFTCLTPQGTVYDTDKFVWLQARQVWIFAKLYLSVEKNAIWKDIALHRADFLIKNGRTRTGTGSFP